MPRGVKPEEQAPAAAAAPKSARVAARVAAKAEEPAPAAAAAPAAKRAGGVKAEAASDANPAALLGAAVRKRFGSAFFAGKVVSFDTKTRWYFVSYDDGDGEELSAAELAPLLVAAAQPKPEKAGKASAAGASAKAKGAARGAPKSEAAPKAARAAPKAESEPPAKKARAAAASPAPAPAAAKQPAAKKAETAKKAAPAQSKPAKASSKPAKMAAVPKKASGKAAKAAVPCEQRFFLPLRTQRSSRWPSGRPVRGLASLAGEWLVYASHHTIPGVDSNCCIYGGEALVQSVGTLELKAAGKDRLSGEMRNFQTKLDGHELGPTVPTAGVQVLASEPSERDSPFGIDPGAPSGAFPAIVTGFSDDRFAAQYGEKTPKPMRAWIDLRSGADESVPALRTQPAGSGGESESDSESCGWDRDMLWPTANSAEEERPACLDAAAPPLPLRTGDLRFTVRWMERGGHGDAGCEMAYLLRRAPAASGAAAPADAVTKPAKPELSWQDYREYRLRDWF
jgi:histone H1/5